jgi:hypothetical protein
MKSISSKEQHTIVFLREHRHKHNHFLAEPNPKGAIQHICTNMLTKQHKHFPWNECSFVHDKNGVRGWTQDVTLKSEVANPICHTKFFIKSYYIPTILNKLCHN